MSTDPTSDSSNRRTRNDSSHSGYGAKHLAHQNAQQRNLEDHISSGEMIEVYIKTPPEKNGGEEAVGLYSCGEVQDVRVFIDPGHHQLYRGCRIRCRVRYLGDSFLKALALYRLD